MKYKVWNNVTKKYIDNVLIDNDGDLRFYLWDENLLQKDNLVVFWEPEDGDKIMDATDWFIKAGVGKI